MQPRHYVAPTGERRLDHPPSSAPDRDDSRPPTYPAEDVLDAVYVADRPLADCPGIPF